MIRHIAWGALAAVGLSLAGCGGVSCTSKGKCPNDTQTIGAVFPNCSSVQAGVCGSQFNDYVGCLLSNEVCDPNGTDDGSNIVACAAKDVSFQACCNDNPSACAS